MTEEELNLFIRNRIMLLNVLALFGIGILIGVAVGYSLR